MRVKRHHGDLESLSIGVCSARCLLREMEIKLIQSDCKVKRDKRRRSCVLEISSRHQLSIILSPCRHDSPAQSYARSSLKSRGTDFRLSVVGTIPFVFLQPVHKKEKVQFLRHVGWMTPTTPKATDWRLFESRAAPPKPQRWKTPSWRQGLEVRLGLRQLNGGRSSNNHCVLRAACRVALNTSDLEAVETHSAATLAANSGCQLKGDATRGWSGDGRRETQQLTRRHAHNGAFLRAFTDLQIGRIDGKNKKKRWNVRLTSKRRSDSICPSYESLLSINLGANLGQWYLHSSVAKK